MIFFLINTLSLCLSFFLFQLAEQRQLIWLLFYDLFKRDFQSRPESLENVINGVELFYVDSMLWDCRIKLGATLSKMRIRNKAYDLEELLPIHLQSSKSNVEDSVICGWVNGFKVS